MENPVHPTDTALSISSRFDWSYQSIIRRMLAPLQQGTLRVTFPNGTTEQFGNGGPTPAAHIRINTEAFYRKIILSGDIGLGESYVDGDWDTDSVVEVIAWFIHNLENTPTASGSRRRFSLGNLLKFVNRWQHNLRHNNEIGARRNIHEHYDLSNDFFRIFLDEGMAYSSAFFSRSEDSLETAQTEKFDRLCRKLQLQATDKLLEIGSGWGGMALHAARHYGCRVYSITISQEQLQYAQARALAAGLNDRVKFELCDYRHVTGQFDKIVSIEMLEAVGHRYFKAFFAKCHEVLKHDGLLGLQVITCPDARYDEYRNSVDWIQKHIFPGGLLPSLMALQQAINATGDLQLHHLEDMGLHYARTLQLWRQKLNRNSHQVAALGFDERFLRKWNYYLGYCEAAFQTRNVSVVQAVYTRPNNLALRESLNL
ncbi:MAG: class I SAM-dependent methyltransferase [Acidobacteria bacterium]|nr:class I SAM-dependent methyltransferase [Acidobacteriota bacterium]